MPIGAILYLIVASIAAGLLGCFAVWRRVEHMGDAASHAMLFGAALSVATSVVSPIPEMVCSFLIAIAMSAKKLRNQSDNLILNVLSVCMMAFGILLISDIGDMEMLEQVAFGKSDILFSKNLSNEILFLFLLSVFILKNKNKWIFRSIGFETERSQSNNALSKYFSEDFSFYLCACLFVAFTARVTGAFFVSAMMLLPAMTAVSVASSVRSMLLLSSVTGIMSVLLGAVFSTKFGTAFGPSCVLCCAIFFIATRLVKNIGFYRTQ